jgi:hypothetical protein
MCVSRKTNQFGLLAEFATLEQLVAAIKQAHSRGYKRLEAYSPIPSSELFDAVGVEHSRIPLITFAGGICGGALGFAVQYYHAAIAYPLNVGGRPIGSWPSFVPVAFELMVLFAALSAMLSMLILNRLPQPYHPLFAAEHFDRASQDRFFLCVLAADSRFDPQATLQFLRKTEATTITNVPL